MVVREAAETQDFGRLFLTLSETCSTTSGKLLSPSLRLL